VVGSNFTLRVSLTEAITRLVLVSARATTHWVDGGPERYLSLEFTQNVPSLEATVPNDPVRALAGYYILFALVDDIPSVGKIVRITATPAPSPIVPSVSLSSADSIATEPANTASFTVTRTGVTSAPMLVNYSIGGTAINGIDYNALPNFVTIPAGAFSTTVTLVPRDDSLVPKQAHRGSEVVSPGKFLN
jgi:hypothetical protein